METGDWLGDGTRRDAKGVDVEEARGAVVEGGEGNDDRMEDNRSSCKEREWRRSWEDEMAR
jgi:hypothetical protein